MLYAVWVRPSSDVYMDESVSIFPSRLQYPEPNVVYVHAIKEPSLEIASFDQTLLTIIW